MEKDSILFYIINYFITLTCFSSLFTFISVLKVYLIVDNLNKEIIVIKERLGIITSVENKNDVIIDEVLKTIENNSCKQIPIDQVIKNIENNSNNSIDYLPIDDVIRTVESDVVPHLIEWNFSSILTATITILILLKFF